MAKHRLLRSGIRAAFFAATALLSLTLIGVPVSDNLGMTLFPLFIFLLLPGLLLLLPIPGDCFNIIGGSTGSLCPSPIMTQAILFAAVVIGYFLVGVLLEWQYGKPGNSNKVF